MTATVPDPQTYMKRQAVLTMLVCILAALSGCASPYEGAYAFREGWRKARVVQAGAASSLPLREKISDCRRTAAAEQLQDGIFALVSYVEFGHRRSRVVVLPANSHVAAGDTVYVKWGSCSGEVAAQPLPQR